MLFVNQKTISYEKSMYLLVIGMIFPVLAQENLFDDLYESGDLPAVVLKKAGEEFSIYYPDNKNPDSRILKLEKTFISYKLKAEEGESEAYLLLFKLDDGFLSASFNEKGKLISVIEKFRNVKLPELVRKNLAEKFPEWSLVKDKYLYVQRNGSVRVKEYKVIIKKGNKIRRVILNEDGVIIRGKS